MHIDVAEQSTLNLGSLYQLKGQDEWIETTAAPADAQLIMCFGPTAGVVQPGVVASLKQRFPEAIICGGSTGHAIVNDVPRDDAVCATAIRFSECKVQMAVESLEGVEGAAACGRALARSLKGEDLSLLIVFSDGLHVNGDVLVRAISGELPEHVQIIGGLAGDGDAFEKTVTIGDAAAKENQIVAIGIYGDALRVSHGSAGGWNTFGPERTITASEGAILHEIDGKAALDLYERYLGEEAEGLPGSALLYPLQIWDPASDNPPVVRTILGIDDEQRTMTFAGDMPEGWKAQLMIGRQDSLVDGARLAASHAHAQYDPSGVQGGILALLVSCVGRQLCMQQYTGDEVAAIRQVSPHGTEIAGFYSYGEISSRGNATGTGLLNQTMTSTYIWEAANRS